MSKFKVLIADDRHGSYQQERDVLEPLGVELIFTETNDQNVLSEQVKDIDALLVNLAPVTEKVISNMTKCKCICRYGVGYDNVNTEAIKKRGITLANVRGYCDEDVSDHAFALMFDCLHCISEKNKMVKEGKWNLISYRKVLRFCELNVGLIGFGSIAKCLNRKLQGFNPKNVFVYDPFISKNIASENNVNKVDLIDLCSQSDIISLHAPLNKETRNILSDEQFMVMKHNVIIVNTSRGPLIDEQALYKFLNNGKIAAAGLDVFQNEPLESASPLRNLENVIMTDHAGWYTEQSVAELKQKAALNIYDVLKGNSPRYEVKL